MSDIYVRNPLNPSKVVRFTVNVRQVTDVSYDPPEHLFQDLPRLKGDLVWIMEIGTTEPDINGDSIPPSIVHLITLSDLDAEIQKALQEMCVLIDWSPLIGDIAGPYVYWYEPNSNLDSVYLGSDIYVKIKEDTPSMGIDFSSIEAVITISGEDPTKIFAEEDISSELNITGTIYDCQLFWKPQARYYEKF